MIQIYVQTLFTVHFIITVNCTVLLNRYWMLVLLLVPKLFNLLNFFMARNHQEYLVTYFWCRHVFCFKWTTESLFSCKLHTGLPEWLWGPVWTPFCNTLKLWMFINIVVYFTICFTCLRLFIVSHYCFIFQMVL